LNLQNLYVENKGKLPTYAGCKRIRDIGTMRMHHLDYSEA